jgi:hypothetical protein
MKSAPLLPNFARRSPRRQGDSLQHRFELFAAYFCKNCCIGANISAGGSLLQGVPMVWSCCFCAFTGSGLPDASQRKGSLAKLLVRRQKYIAREFACLGAKNGGEIDALKLRDICRKERKSLCSPQHHPKRSGQAPKGSDSMKGFLQAACCQSYR